MYVVLLIDMWELGLYSAMAPFGLMILASVWHYPAILEEVVKWGIMRTQILDARREILGGTVVGLVFGMSEAVLFTTNAWMSGDWIAIGARLVLTVPMHTLSAVIIALGMKHKMQWVGLAVAMMIHGIFNYWVGLIA